MAEIPQTLPEPQPVRRRSPLRRLGCGILLVLWFLVLLTPCGLFMLASRGELTLDLGSAPGQSARIWLVMEPDERGIGLSLPTVHSGADADSMCVQTDVRYFLWQGEAEPLSYCDCYRRDDARADWIYLETLQGMCSPDALSATPEA